MSPTSLGIRLQAPGGITRRDAEALALSEEWVQRAETAKDTEGRALLLSWHGYALASMGQPRGIEQMQEAVTILAAHGNSATSVRPATFLGNAATPSTPAAICGGVAFIAKRPVVESGVRSGLGRRAFSTR